MCNLNIKQGMSFVTILVLAGYVTSAPPPVQNFTTITLYTDTMTWNNAKLFCSGIGDKLLNPTYYSIYNTLFIHASLSPWKDLPITNGPPAWTSLHRRITPVGDDYYGDNCEALSEFNVIRWDANFGPPDGPSDAMCVLHSSVADATNTFNDYTNTNCSEKHRFYCQHEEGPCEFEEYTGYGGYTSNDATYNDIVLTLDTLESCKERCLNESYVRSSTGPNTYTEECWGFTTTAWQCIIHIVLQPTHFDSYKIYYGNRNLYIKRCFATAVNTTVLNVILADDSSDQPNSTCGIPILGNSTILSQEVIVSNGSWTWNEAFQTCKAFGSSLFDLTADEVRTTFRQFMEEDNNIEETLWLGLHEPDPQNYPDVRVWSTCGNETTFTWGPDTIPSSDLLDTSLCTIINTTSHVWRTVPCNQTHQFLCIGNLGNNWSYSNGTKHAIGTDVSLGPYDVTIETCQSQCNSWTYKEMECRAFAYMEAADEQFCRLYFAETALTSESSSIVEAENYTFYRKLSWNVDFMSDVQVTDDSVLPYSCCDLSLINLSKSCPVETLPTYETQLPTTEATTFLLFTSPVGWNVAQSTCRTRGGDLVQTDRISKRHALRHYVKSWIQDGLITGPLWQGMVTTNSSDPCSAKWTRDCSTPEWLLTTIGSGDPQYCATIDSDANITFVNCNQSLSFVCELSAETARWKIPDIDGKTPTPRCSIRYSKCSVDIRETPSSLLLICFAKYKGKCNMSSTYTDTTCLPGQYGVSVTTWLSTCEQACLTGIYQGMECWAMKPISNFYCDVTFYVDPMYCVENNEFERNTDTTLKNCYGATVDTSQLLVTDEGNHFSAEPNSTCFAFTFPYAPEISKCGSTRGSVTSAIPSVATLNSEPPIMSETSLLPMTPSQATLSIATTPATSNLPLMTSSTAMTPVTSTTYAMHSVTTSPVTALDFSTSSATKASSIPPVITYVTATSDFQTSVFTSIASTVTLVTTSLPTLDFPTIVTLTTSAVSPIVTSSATSSDSLTPFKSITSTVSPTISSSFAETALDFSTPSASETSIISPVVTSTAATSDFQTSTFTSTTPTVTLVTTSLAKTSDFPVIVTPTTSTVPQVTTSPTTSDFPTIVSSTTSTVPLVTTSRLTSDFPTLILSTTSTVSPMLTSSPISSDSLTSFESTTSTIPMIITTQSTTTDFATMLTTAISTLPTVTPLSSTTSGSSISVTLATIPLHPVSTSLETTSDLSTQISSQTSLPSITTSQMATSNNLLPSVSTLSVFTPETTPKSTILDYSTQISSTTFATLLDTTSVTNILAFSSGSVSSSIQPVTSSISTFPSTAFPPGTSKPASISPTQPTTATNFTRIYIWPCLCNPYNKTSNLTTEEWAEWVQTVLTVKNKNTSRYRRTITSAEDHRVSASSLGSLAAGIMGTITFVVIFTDVLTLVQKGRSIIIK